MTAAAVGLRGRASSGHLQKPAGRHDTIGRGNVAARKYQGKGRGRSRMLECWRHGFGWTVQLWHGTCLTHSRCGQPFPDPLCHPASSYSAWRDSVTELNSSTAARGLVCLTWGRAACPPRPSCACLDRAGQRRQRATSACACWHPAAAAAGGLRVGQVHLECCELAALAGALFGPRQRGHVGPARGGGRGQVGQGSRRQSSPDACWYTETCVARATVSSTRCLSKKVPPAQAHQSKQQAACLDHMSVTHTLTSCSLWSGSHHPKCVDNVLI